MPHKFEDMEVWKLSRQLTNEIYNIDYKNDYGLADQIRRASLSIMSNIAEGMERGSNKELIQFLYIAKGSCGEVRCQLYITYDRGYIKHDCFIKLTELAKKISIMLFHLISHLRKSHFIGARHSSKILSLKEVAEKILKEVMNENSSSSSNSSNCST